jgi:citrate synthase
MQSSAYIPGLEGVVAAQTRLSHVDGQAGQLVIAGFPLEEIAPYASFEEMVYLLWNGDLPAPRQS